MNAKSKRALSAAIRKVVLAGIILLAVRLILLALRAPLLTNAIEHQQTIPMPISSIHTWDWTKSIRTSELVSRLIGQNLGTTLRMMALIAAMSLVIAGVLLFIGVLISRITQKPAWLGKARGILRLLLVGSGAGVPVFIISAFIMFFIIRYNPSAPHPLPVFWSVCFFSMPLTWLLVQTGHGLLTNQTENRPGWKLIYDTGIRLFIRLLKLMGFVIVITIFEGESTNHGGLGRLFISNMSSQDYPVAFGIIWVFVIIVVLATLTAELLEIAHNYYAGRTVLIEPIVEKPRKPGIPKGWLMFSLGLLALTTLVAVIGPLLAPYAINRIDLMNRLATSSAGHLLGTDQLGRDILSQLLYGTRIDIFAGLACAAIVSLLAGGWAMLAACCKNMNNRLGDTLEDIVMLPRKIICSFPWLVLLFLLEPFLAGRSILFVAFLAGLVVLPRTTGMIQEAYGAPPERLNWRLTILRSIPVAFIFTAAAVIIYIATISYLGFGVNPGTSEFGAMISGGGLQYIQTAPRLLIWPSICLIAILIVWVMAGDALLERLGFRSKAVWSKTME